MIFQDIKCHMKDLQTRCREPGYTIFVFGDLQIGSKGFSKTAWEEFKTEFKSTPGAYALGLGDYEDWLRPTIRAHMYSALNIEDDERRQLDDKVRRDNDGIIKELSFMEGRCLGLHSGHHEWTFATGENSTQRLASALKCPYLGWVALTRLSFLCCRREYKMSYHGYKGQRRGYTILSMHGSGSAQFASTDARWLETRIVPAFVVDHYVRGHSCKSMAWEPFVRYIVPLSSKLPYKMQRVRCMNVGGFTYGYTDGWNATYVEKAGFLPQPISWGIIRIRITRKHANAYDEAPDVPLMDRHTLHIEQTIHGPEYD